jgi:hypothetical protein
VRHLVELALSISVFTVGACGSGGGFPDAHKLEPAPAPGTFSVKWSITNGSGGSAETCTQAMATQVVVTTTNEATSDENSEQFTCGLGEAVSGALFIGTYDLTFALVGSAGTALATAPQQAGIVISSDNTTAVAPITFAVAM